ncbi:hypothetical protein LXG23DRAFT_50886 [Yarrowia lipolytica]|jgi:NAD(P)-dependent dehydrogenase (short-subunit alcohol dehydrogenase family)|uniref:Uncharacterized protein n=1 Tax=Yarrowia lipolytica TaxID=4952 RepID=A0A1H6PX14_YARLL|nr:hypothetical protein YALI1_A02443g [Yarrowia lipolytica]KAB8284270.1 hypothetical protein BKA91DRAFT_135560 [Yarrowia lipolytica]KAE8169882.1 hypothetical protein BKA90DRAFT_141779 [Yarrowia lipolytica]KAJ8051286.1 hypothetical protein LXG23DRAFT_50886 [Yarrowia lipolytica]QNP95659.1 Oxidoreductase BOA17 [Yarrowia lipolytica]
MKKVDNGPKAQVWFICNINTQVGVEIAQRVLHDNNVVIGGINKGLGNLEVGETTSQDNLQLLLSKHGSNNSLSFVEIDPANSTSCQMAFSDAFNRRPTVDVLVNCSHTMVLGEASRYENWQVNEQFESNFFHHVNVIKAILPHFRRQLQGHIINIMDSTASLAIPGLSLLCAANRALSGFCESLALEVSRFGIKITNIIAPLEASLFTQGVVMTEDEQTSEHVTRLRNIIVREDIYPQQAITDIVHGVISIACNPNPPHRFVIGSDSITAVKEQIQREAEELDDMMEVSYSCDFDLLEPEHVGYGNHMNQKIKLEHDETKGTYM